jgi:MoxR-vWA-beta-propeller ternary system domain bpX3
MEFNIRPFHKNSYPRQGVLIKSPDAVVWLQEAYKMGLDPEHAAMYAVPGAAANQLFGCLVVPKLNAKIADVGKNSFMQCLNHKLFIPENTVVFPELSAAEWAKLFPGAVYIMHPDTGLAELTEEIDWSLLLELPQLAPAAITVPSKGVYIPQAIRSISIEADKDELTESIEKQVGAGVTDVDIKMEKIMKGNQREIDKLLKYLEKHPEAALTLGIPLDVMGSSRGGGGGKFVFGKGGGGSFSTKSDVQIILYIFGGIIAFMLLMVFLSTRSGSSSSYFPFFIIFLLVRLIYAFLKKNGAGKSSGSGRAATIDKDTFADLQKKYNDLAESYLAQKDYKKAAGVYLKLLKNHRKAAHVLEEAGFYAEAGAIHLKYSKDKLIAAQCFEKGRLYSRAIELYKELEQTEKVADLYTLLNQNNEAARYYTIVAEDYIKNKQYVMASLIYRKKMQQPLEAQELLLVGWHKKLDAHNCLNNYFANIENPDVLIREIKRFYNDELEDNRKEAFLQIIKIEFHKHKPIQEPIREIAYEIIASCIETNPSIASDLMAFNPDDKSLTKDVLKFKASKIKRG